VVWSLRGTEVLTWWLLSQFSGAIARTWACTLRFFFLFWQSFPFLFGWFLKDQAINLPDWVIMVWLWNQWLLLLPPLCFRWATGPEIEKDLSQNKFICLCIDLLDWKLLLSPDVLYFMISQVWLDQNWILASARIWQSLDLDKGVTIESELLEDMTLAKCGAWLTKTKF
jgi:hypothetical protein